MINEVQWAGLAIRSESDQPHEFLPLAWVIRNRVEGPKWYGNNVRDVVLKPWQFSFFNRFIGSPGTDVERYDESLREYPGRNLELLELAEEAWRLVGYEEAPRIMAPFSADVRHFWTPKLIREPFWLSDARRTFSLPGIDPERWMFAEGVKPT